LLALPLGVRAVRVVTSNAVGPALIPVLKGTGLTELVFAVGLAAGLALGR
jgi:1,4-dihydroxy-2-naphthoate octaprenyltransferase